MVQTHRFEKLGTLITHSDLDALDNSLDDLIGELIDISSFEKDVVDREDCTADRRIRRTQFAHAARGRSLRRIGNGQAQLDRQPH